MDKVILKDHSCSYKEIEIDYPAAKDSLGKASGVYQEIRSNLIGIFLQDGNVYLYIRPHVFPCESIQRFEMLQTEEDNLLTIVVSDRVFQFQYQRSYDCWVWQAYLEAEDSDLGLCLSEIYKKRAGFNHLAKEWDVGKALRYR